MLIRVSTQGSCQNMLSKTMNQAVVNYQLQICKFHTYSKRITLSYSPLLIIFFTLLISACASNNASKIQSTSFLKNQTLGEDNRDLPVSELAVIFEISQTNLELKKILTTPMSSKELTALLEKNKNKNFSKGEPLTDCIILTNTRVSKSCFNNAKNNIPKTSVFHDSSVSAGMVALTVLVPYVVVAAAGDDDFYVINEIDRELLNKVGATLRKTILDKREQINTSLKNLDFSALDDNNLPYGQLLNHELLTRAIDSLSSLEQHKALSHFIDNIDYNGYIVKSSVVNQRAKPSTRAKIQRKRNRGELVFAVKEQDGWIFNGEGWIYKKILTQVANDAQTRLASKQNYLALKEGKRAVIANKNKSSADIEKLLMQSESRAGVSQADISELQNLKRELLEKEAFLVATKANTVLALSRFLNSYSNGVYSKEANSIREKVWFAGLKDSDATADEYQDFIFTYPKSEYVKALRLQWYKQALEIRTVSAFKGFLKGFAKDDLEKKVQEQWFLLVAEENTIEAYRDYLRNNIISAKSIEAEEALEGLWFASISDNGYFNQISSFLSEVPRTIHRSKLVYAKNNCPLISSRFDVSSDECVKQFLNIENLRMVKSFSAYAKAYALSGTVSDFNNAQKFAKTDSQKRVVEYFALLAMTNMHRLFDFEISDKHTFNGSREHSTWFAQGKGSSSANIKGEIVLFPKNDAPFDIKYGRYVVNIKLSVLARYSKEVASNWIGNSTTTPTVKKGADISFNVSAGRTRQKQTYDFGTMQIAYKDTGMMGGYTAQYLTNEMEFLAQVVSVKPTFPLNIF